jgi:hypothetical protein
MQINNHQIVDYDDVLCEIWSRGTPERAEAEE